MKIHSELPLSYLIAEHLPRRKNLKTGMDQPHVEV